MDSLNDPIPATDAYHRCQAGAVTNDPDGDATIFDSAWDILNNTYGDEEVFKTERKCVSSSFTFH